MRPLLSFCLGLILTFGPYEATAVKHRLPAGIEVELEHSNYVALTLEEYRAIGLVYVDANRLASLEAEYVLKIKSFDDTEEVWHARLAGCEDSLKQRTVHSEFLGLSLVEEREGQGKLKTQRTLERIIGVSVIVLLLGLNTYQGIKLAK